MIKRDQTRHFKVQNNQLRTVGLIIVGLVAAVGFVWVLAQLTSTTTTVILVNDGDCPRALLQLTPRDGGGVITVVAEPGQSIEVNVTPDIIYDFVMTTESPNVDDEIAGELARVCFDRDEGEIEVPEGGTFTYRVESVTRPFVVFEVDDACPSATILISAPNDEYDPFIVDSGQSQEREIAPDRAYTYSIELVRLADPAANICSGVESAQITLRMGESETIRIQPDTTAD